jgi:hypothetical protein
MAAKTRAESQGRAERVAVHAQRPFPRATFCKPGHADLLPQSVAHKGWSVFDGRFRLDGGLLVSYSAP